MPQKIPLQKIKLYKRGQYAQHNGNTFVIDHVTIRGGKLFVHFEDVQSGVDAEYVSVEVTVIDFNRDNGGPKCYVLRSEKPDVPDPNSDLPDEWIL